MNPPQHPHHFSRLAHSPLSIGIIRAQIITSLVFWAIYVGITVLTGPIIGRGVFFQFARFAMEALFWTALLVTVVAFYSASKYSVIPGCIAVLMAVLMALLGKYPAGAVLLLAAVVSAVRFARSVRHDHSYGYAQTREASNYVPMPPPGSQH